MTRTTQANTAGILLLLALGFAFLAMDRHNIALAKLQMQRDIRISDAQYGLAAGLFFIGYVLFEVPSNLLLTRIGARKTLCRIMALWGLASAATLFVVNAYHLYALRFLLGVFEAGFAPGVIFYLSGEYPESHTARALAAFMCASPLAGVVMGPLSTGLMTALDGVAGLKGWQWMFVVEGLPCVLLGRMIWTVMQEQPAHSAQQAMKTRFACERVLKNPRVYGLAFSNFCLVCGAYTVIFWLPTLLKSAGMTDALHIGLWSSVPYLTAVIAMRVCARHSDRCRERRGHIGALMLISALTLALSAQAEGHPIRATIYHALAFASIWSATVLFWALTSAYLKSNHTAAAGIAWINSLSLLGGFVSPVVIGWVKTITGNFQSGVWIMAGLLFAGAVAMAYNPLIETSHRC